MLEVDGKSISSSGKGLEREREREREREEREEREERDRTVPKLLSGAPHSAASDITRFPLGSIFL